MFQSLGAATPKAKSPVRLSVLLCISSRYIIQARPSSGVGLLRARPDSGKKYKKGQTAGDTGVNVKDFFVTGESPASGFQDQVR